LNDATKFEYFGLSPFEIEVIYNTLSKFSAVDEKILVEESEYVTLLKIEFPVPYDDNSLDYLVLIIGRNLRPYLTK